MVSVWVGRVIIVVRGNIRVGNVLKVGVIGKDGFVDCCFIWLGIWWFVVVLVFGRFVRFRGVLSLNGKR